MDNDDLDARLAPPRRPAGRHRAGTGKPVAARDIDDRAAGNLARATQPRAPEEDLITRPRPGTREPPRRALPELAAALLVVARDALPPLVENDDQANLATLVDTLKRHLDDGGRGPVDEELATLYRAASAHLKTGARAYAENVGSSRRPILLGDVLVGASTRCRRRWSI